MTYPFGFYLILFSLFSIFCHLDAQGLGWCEALFQCGNIAAGFPFWGGSLRPKQCGHPLLELRCFKNVTSLNISNYEYNIFNIDQTSNTLSLARKDLLGSFCSATFKTTTLPPKIFELSPIYKSLTVLYQCDPKLSYHSSYTCPNLGVLSVSQSFDYQSSCQNSFVINVPTSFVPEERELNLSRLESALRKGFEVKLVVDEKPCHECSSSNGICGFNSTTEICCSVTSPSGGCVPQHQPTADDLYSLCSTTFSCGDHVGLKYPLWIPSREACGHPDFKLNCSGGLAEINISTVKFRIIDTMRSKYLGITLVRSDYIGNLFPRNPKNVQFNENVVHIPFYTELLTIYYDCPNFSPLWSGSSYVGEFGSGDDIRNYYVTKNLTSHLLQGIRSLLNNFREMCKRNVSIPASGSALETLQRSPSQYNLQKALEQGFDIYVNTDCSSCMYTGGACGYNQTSSVFVCYCKDGPHNSSCHHTGFDPRGYIGA